MQLLDDEQLDDLDELLQSSRTHWNKGLFEELLWINYVRSKE